ncbi:MAG: hypothetical protein ABMA14_07670 [Hyphomonadaceae bacterium]
MIWRKRLQQLVDRPAWRRHAPAVGTVVVHLAVAAVFAGMMGAVKAEHAPRVKPQKIALSVELLALPEVEAGVTPPPLARPAVPTERPMPALPTDKRKVNVPERAAPAEEGAVDDNTFYLPPSDPALSGEAKGLASLMGDDACVARFGPKARECAGRELARRTGAMDSVLARPKEQLAQFFGEFMPTCEWKVGCERKEWISTNGTRSVGRGGPHSPGDHDASSPMAGGASSVGGLNNIVGRMAPKPDYIDPGFGD